ncbi:MAG: hypothetical protein QXK37_01335 [Candidatus Woesearchaeota archaeon]
MFHTENQIFSFERKSANDGKPTENEILNAAIGKRKLFITNNGVK